MSIRTDRTPLDLAKNGVSRYSQLGTLFRRKVETGEWPLGEQIPTIDRLAEEYGVAKLTIRQALRLLEQDGLIDRFRAKGTFVKAKPSRELWCEVHTDFSGMLTARKGAVIEVLDERRQSALPHAELHGAQAAPSYRALRRRHARDGRAFLLADVYIDERLTKAIPKSAYQSKTALRLISDVPGIEITAVRQTLTIGSADLEISSILDIPINSPVAFVERVVMVADGSVALLTIGAYRGDVVRLDMQTSSIPGKKEKA
ncbi:MAG: GntR family transcriptional regulator [Beijerinckiaceae bacterium]|nr:GntR family transcriptional regulator [Beijerinckiaceae bacterium]